MRLPASLLLGLLAVRPVHAGETPAPSAAKAVERGLKRIAEGVASYPQHRKCFSCHHQAMAVLTMTAARQRGFAIDDDLFKQTIDFSLKTFRNKTAIARGTGVGGDSTGVVYVLHTLAAAGHAYDDTTAALVRYLLVKQRKDGAWPIAPLGDRPPTMGSLFTNAGLALAVLKRYSPPDDDPDREDLQRRIDDAFIKGRAWLLANKPAATEDKVFHLRGLVDGGVAAKTIDLWRDGLIKDQRPDGSWAQLPDMAGDAYASATALVALSYAGLDTSHETHKKGIGYLLKTQQADGGWIVKTRSKPLQVFFDNGDPGGKSQFISFTATNWALLAILETLPKKK